MKEGLLSFLKIISLAELEAALATGGGRLEAAADLRVAVSSGSWTIAAVSGVDAVVEARGDAAVEVLARFRSRPGDSRASLRWIMSACPRAKASPSRRAIMRASRLTAMPASSPMTTLTSWPRTGRRSNSGTGPMRCAGKAPASRPGATHGWSPASIQASRPANAATSRHGKIPASFCATTPPPMPARVRSQGARCLQRERAG